MIFTRAFVLTSAALAVVCAASSAWAQAASPTPARSNAPAPAALTAPPGLFECSTLLGDWGSARPRLSDAGVTVGLSEVSEVLGNVSGGFRRGATYNGLTTLTVTVDAAKAFGLKGGTFNASVLNIHGRSLSEYYLGTLQTSTGIDAAPATRLWEFWYQQTFANGRADLKLGQQSIDQEFIDSQGSSLFVNAMMGWPLVPSVDLYAGGPAYPLASLGARLRVRPTASTTVLVGVFNDNPPGGAFNNDSQLRGREGDGTEFNLDTGAPILGEVQHTGWAQPVTATR